MSQLINKLQNKVLQGEDITREEALDLWDEDTGDLTAAAHQITVKIQGNAFDLCAITNGKSGKCSENCKFCAQSSHYPTGVREFPLISKEEIVREGQARFAEGIKGYAVVTSGRRLTKEEIRQIAAGYRGLKATTNLRLCGSLGLLDKEDFETLKAGGMERCHNNLEACADFFTKICTTHRYEDKIAAIKAAKGAGMTICSGGIIGMGETPTHRIDLALALRDLEVDSVPINLLNPVKGTPLENVPPLTYEEIAKTVAVFRFILPNVSLRLAGGRGLLADKGKSLLKAGINSAISGDMLTTAGISTKTDLAMVKEAGFEVGDHD